MNSVDSTHSPHSINRRLLLTVSVASAGVSALSALGCSTSSGTCPQPRTPPSPCPVCPPTQPAALTPEALKTLGTPPGPLDIVHRVEGGVNVLRYRARPISPSDNVSRIKLLERRMRETLASTGRGVGLAAPQVNISARAIVVMLGAKGKHPEVRFFVNPRIVERSDAITLDVEGCLSVPGLVGLVKRSKRLVIEHGLPGTTPQRLAVQDFDARIFQHEIDHLEGILYVDRVEGSTAPRDKLEELRKKLRAEQPEVACTPMFYGEYRDEVLL